MREGQGVKRTQEEQRREGTSRNGQGRLCSPRRSPILVFRLLFSLSFPLSSSFLLLSLSFSCPRPSSSPFLVSFLSALLPSSSSPLAERPPLAHRPPYLQTGHVVRSRLHGAQIGRPQHGAVVRPPGCSCAGCRHAVHIEPGPALLGRAGGASEEEEEEEEEVRVKGAGGAAAEAAAASRSASGSATIARLLAIFRRR